MIADSTGKLEDGNVYPHCHVIARRVRTGGLSKAELLEQLCHNGVEINEAGRALFASDRFATSGLCTDLNTVELSVRNLGFPQGATISEIYAGAVHLGLHVCPVELGPHLRLQWLDQPEGFVGHPAWQHRAPPGSI